MKNKEIELILTKLKIVSEEKNGCYICDREHSKLLLSYIEQLEEDNILIKSANKLVSGKLEQLENNRDKAIELIEKELKYPPKYLTGYSAIQVLNILKGGSDEKGI